MKVHVYSLHKFSTSLKALSQNPCTRLIFSWIKPFGAELVLLVFIIFLLVFRTDRVEHAAFDPSSLGATMQEINEHPTPLKKA